MEKSAPSPRFFHRDLSWLLFNRRVIAQGESPENPLLEQLRFLAIASNNADEFFMVRIPRIQTLVRMGRGADEATGLSQEAILQEAAQRQRENLRLQSDYYQKLLTQLRKKGYYLKTFTELSIRENKQAVRYFEETILPTLTPVGVDAYHAFPRLLEKALHFWIELTDDEGETHQAILPISIQLPRLFQLSARRFILVEELIQHFLERLFVGYEIQSSFLFRVTYDHDLEFHEDQEEDLSEQMADYLEERKKGHASRLEVDFGFCPQQPSPAPLMEKLALDETAVFESKTPLDLTFLFGLIDQVGKKNPQWLYPPLQADLPQNWLAKNILQTLEQTDILAQHPYDSFEVVIEFLKAAVADPRTVAIKQTLYRVAKGSKIISLLKRAAKKGIQVTVLVELKARFDEERNLHWVEELEAAGCFVSYGFPNLKTHSKALLVVQKDGEEIKRYAQIGTGNYNETNSRIYTDLSFLTSREDYVNDLTDFFNYLTGYRIRPRYRKLVTSPNDIRERIIKRLEEVIKYHQRTGKGEVFAKMNALTDIPLIKKLYEASQAGVKIFLQVRGACCLVPGVPGLSENITVDSLVGRFLEHSRICSFTTGRGKEYWISSADWMTRNMVQRVEIATPLKGTSIEKQIAHLATVYQDTLGTSWLLDQQEVYRQQPGTSAQRVFLEDAQRRVAANKQRSSLRIQINTRQNG